MFWAKELSNAVEVSLRVAEFHLLLPLRTVSVRASHPEKNILIKDEFWSIILLTFRVQEPLYQIRL